MLLARSWRSLLAAAVMAITSCAAPSSYVCLGTQASNARRRRTGAGAAWGGAVCARGRKGGSGCGHTLVATAQNAARAARERGGVVGSRGGRAAGAGTAGLGRCASTRVASF
ncbi:MAG: hypothetical protein J3K34DRAFT_401729 [Monoraphidium minutum]|nr:MAG: hypothetical protein J3K34DRAFT_401729 [Monoraphidium minutum]